jgi:hypothetical protein
MAIVSCLLSLWAIYYNYEVVTPLKIDRKQEKMYLGKADHSYEKGLSDSVASIWYSISDRDRDLMIKLWLI